MASSDSLFQQNFNIDSWLLPDLFSHDSDLLTKALHKSISTSTTTDPPLSPSLYFDSITDLSPPQTLSNVSFGSDPETGSKRKRNCTGTGAKPVVKRRSRVSTKKTQTTFITADVANFRQMVQQVTGAKFFGSSSSSQCIVKPEPHRLATRVVTTQSGIMNSCAVPTLDTSSFLSSQVQSSGVANVTVDVCGGGGGGSGLELDSYPSFPTLESWKVM